MPTPNAFLNENFFSFSSQYILFSFIVGFSSFLPLISTLFYYFIFIYIIKRHQKVANFIYFYHIPFFLKDVKNLVISELESEFLCRKLY